jgi:membrane fusion protein (multidrug efflux system)
LITSISQVDLKKISFSVPEKYSSEIKAGMKVDFNIEGNEYTYSATVLASETIIESQTRNLRILATVGDQKNNLVPGSFAKVKLTLGKNESAVNIPSQAVIPSARSKQVVIYKNGSPQFVDITTGIRTADNVQVKSGLSVGDTVITTGLLFIRKDSKLKLSKVQ